MTVIVETDDLAVEDRVVRAYAMRDFRTEHVPLAEDVTAATDEAALVALHMRDRTKTRRA